MQIISQSANSLGAHFVARKDNGKILAGRSKDSAREYDSASEARQDYYEQACNGDHGAWNICYMLQGD